MCSLLKQVHFCKRQYLQGQHSTLASLISVPYSDNTFPVYFASPHHIPWQKRGCFTGLQWRSITAKALSLWTLAPVVLTEPRCSSAVSVSPMFHDHCGGQLGAGSLGRLASPAASDVWGHGVGERPWWVLEVNELSMWLWRSQEPFIRVWLWMWNITGKLLSVPKLPKAALTRASWYTELWKSPSLLLAWLSSYTHIEKSTGFLFPKGNTTLNTCLFQTGRSLLDLYYIEICQIIHIYKHGLLTSYNCFSLHATPMSSFLAFT